MSATVVVLGAGYAGVRAVQRLDDQLPASADLLWIDDDDYHLVLHEVHRAIRDPGVESSIKIPIEEVTPDRAEFVQGHVTELDTDDRTIALEGGETVDYDYVLVALGSQTAFFGIPGLDEYAHTLKSFEDAAGIHDAVAEAAADATEDAPARVVVGGAGLSGIQAAGEIAEYRADHDAPLEIVLVEALEEIFPGNDRSVQRELRLLLREHDVRIMTDDPVTEVTETEVHFDERDPLTYDVLVWAGGITGQEALSGANVEAEHNRLTTNATFQTSDERVFAVGDSALVDDDGEVPPTAQAAWRAAETAADNLVNAMEGEPLTPYTHVDKGTAISVGEDAVVHDVQFLPIKTFGSLPAVTLKKAIAARWIADVAGTKRALKAWADL